MARLLIAYLLVSEKSGARRRLINKKAAAAGGGRVVVFSQGFTAGGVRLKSMGGVGGPRARKDQKNRMARPSFETCALARAAAAYLEYQSRGKHRNAPPDPDKCDNLSVAD